MPEIFIKERDEDRAYDEARQRRDDDARFAEAPCSYYPNRQCPGTCGGAGHCLEAA